MSRVFLILNTGSSTIKFALHNADTQACIAHGVVEGVGRVPRLALHRGKGVQILYPDLDDGAGTQALVHWLLSALTAELGPMNLAAAGHRVVHGGRDYAAPVQVTDDVMATLRALCPLAPGHQPYNLAGIEAVAQHWPGTRQIACFDTAFHQSRPRLAQLFALPRALSDA